MTEIDRRLTELKDAARVTWDQLAERAGLSVSGLRRIRLGQVVPREITREGLAYAVRVDRAVIDGLFGVDPSVGLSVARPRNLFRHRVPTGSESKTAVTALLADLPPQILAELTEPEVVAIQAKLSEYAHYVATQTIRERK